MKVSLSKCKLLYLLGNYSCLFEQFFLYLFRPCILIFDSLTGAPRSRVVATLRDYLTCEYKAKYPDQPPRAFTKDNLLGSQCKVPQQNNFIDCGLFLLQYVEQFFKDPIKDFRIPIKTLTEWFPHDVVTRKREEIANLIKDIIKREVPEGIQLPEIEFPTKDGIITEQNQSKTIDSAFDEKVENTSTVEESNGNDQEPKGNTKKVYLSRKRVIDRKEHNGDGTSPKTAKTS
jgi:sentrin-specific protease 7